MDARGSRNRPDGTVEAGKWKIPETTPARLRGGKAWGKREQGGGAIDGAHASSTYQVVCRSKLLMGRILYDSVEESKGDVRATRKLVMCEEERKEKGWEESSRS